MQLLCLQILYESTENDFVKILNEDRYKTTYNDHNFDYFHPHLTLYNKTIYAQKLLEEMLKTDVYCQKLFRRGFFPFHIFCIFQIF